ncbi:hypothetical protein HSR121_2032 [Halapricum desulfuricans]|uniref:Uncharacterized protein n=1 Tax=Halapricum desulfuricans TaxID=2841257 RepID=A0A897N0Z6_9EURY|nr:hypothetical protein HSR121_2032 [Halapricum desulfuricans]
MDEASGKIVVDGLILTDMDIDPRQNRVTMMVSSDIGYDNRTEDKRYVEGGRFEIA